MCRGDIFVSVNETFDLEKRISNQMKTITRLTLALLLAASFSLVGCSENTTTPDSEAATSESDAGEAGGSESTGTEGTADAGSEENSGGSGSH